MLEQSLVWAKYLATLCNRHCWETFLPRSSLANSPHKGRNGVLFGTMNLDCCLPVDGNSISNPEYWEVAWLGVTRLPSRRVTMAPLWGCQSLHQSQALPLRPLNGHLHASWLSQILCGESTEGDRASTMGSIISNFKCNPTDSQMHFSKFGNFAPDIWEIECRLKIRIPQSSEISLWK